MNTEELKKKYDAYKSGTLNVTDDEDARNKIAQAFKLHDEKRYDESEKLLKSLAEQGNADAQFALGMMYGEGKGVKQDIAIAVEWINKAARQGHSDAKNNLKQFTGIDKIKSIEDYRKAAEQGNAGAQHGFGNCYLHGFGVPQDNNKAVEWLTKSANNGYAEAQHDLGLYYWIRTNKSKARTINLFLKAAKQGHARSHYILAECYREIGGFFNRIKSKQWYRKAIVVFQKGTLEDPELQRMLSDCYSIEKDYDNAFKWCQKSADQGDDIAQYKLAMNYEYGFGVTKDKAKAVEWYAKSADQGNFSSEHQLKYMSEYFNYLLPKAEKGDITSQYRLAECYENGSGGAPKKTDKAIELYTKLAQQGHTDSQGNLAGIFETGRDGVPKDTAKAIELYRQLAKNGKSWAAKKLKELGGELEEKPAASAPQQQTPKESSVDEGNKLLNLGVQYWNGDGVPQDDVKAIECWNKAADMGNIIAMCNLGSANATGRGLPKNETKAFEFFLKAANQNDSQSQFNLGNFYSTGMGVTQDDKKAVEWYRKAIANGSTKAQVNLDILYQKNPKLRKI